MRLPWQQHEHHIHRFVDDRLGLSMTSDRAEDERKNEYKMRKLYGINPTNWGLYHGEGCRVMIATRLDLDPQFRGTPFWSSICHNVSTYKYDASRQLTYTIEYE